MTAAGAVAALAAAIGIAALRWTPVLALAALVASRRGASAAQRHATWAGALLALALMVPAGAWLPGWELPLPAGATGLGAVAGAGVQARDAEGAATLAGGAAAAEGVPGVATSRPAPWRLLPGLWLAGALALAGGELLQLRATRRLVRSARAIPPGGEEAVVAGGGGLPRPCRTADLPVPAVAGVLRPSVLLPEAWASWPRRWREPVLLHEAAHLERRDLAWQLLGRWLRVAFWFHPGVWLAVRRAASEAEAACDEAVVARGIDRLDYARVLLEVAAAARPSRLPGTALGALARPSQLGERVRRLLEPAPPARRGRRLGAAGLIACGLAVAAARPSLSPPVGPSGAGALALRRVAAGGGEGSGETGETWLLRCAPGDARCEALNRAALGALRDAGASGVALVGRVADGRVEAYAARGVTSGPWPGVPAAPPGSLAKLALAAAWWERGMGDGPLPCPREARTSAGARVEAVTATAAPLTPREMLARSCNTAAAAMAGRLAGRGGERALAAALEPLLPGAGEVRDAEIDWELQAVGIGPLETDPLRVAAFLQAVAGDGRAGEPWYGARPATPSRRLFAPATAAALRAALAETVRHGTASGLGELQRGQGWTLTGKTATVTGPRGRVDGWFAALASDAGGRPERVVVVWLAGGGPGGRRPARAALELARAARG